MNIGVPFGIVIGGGTLAIIAGSFQPSNRSVPEPISPPIPTLAPLSTPLPSADTATPTPVPVTVTLGTRALSGIHGPHPVVIDLGHGVTCMWVAGATFSARGAAPPAQPEGPSGIGVASDARANYSCGTGWIVGVMSGGVDPDDPRRWVQLIEPGPAGPDQQPVTLDGAPELAVQPWHDTPTLVVATSVMQYDDPRCPQGAGSGQCLADLFTTEG